MSLHTLAHHLQDAGRGDDKVLVHMTPKEVNGLQALAMAHGGSLTTNPKTGLPEAGFLSSLLPMIAGFALAPLTAGTSLAMLGTPMGAALTVGGVTGLATGSLKKGLMAGLGAYGGAGLGAGLAKVGAATPSVMTPAIPNAGVVTPATSTLGGTSQLANVGGVNIAADPMANLAVNTGPAPLAFKSAVPSVTPGMTSSTLNQSLLNPSVDFTAGIPKVTPPPVAATPPPVTAPPQIADFSRYQPAMGGPAPLPASSAPATPSAWDTIGAGAKKSFSSFEGAKGLYDAMPTGSVAALGVTALDAARPDPLKPKKDESLIRPYEYTREVNPGVFETGAPMWADQPGSSAERTYFTETMTPLKPYKAPGPEYAAEGGLMGLAVGGPVETMSAENAVGRNLMYPQANINTPMYSNPAVQRPEAVNLIAPSADTGVGEFTGEVRFAEGGTAAVFGGDAKAPPMKGGYSYSYDPKTLTFTQTGRPTYDTSGRGLISQLLAKQNSMPANGTTYGGIAQPAMQAAPTAPAPRTFTPPPVPAYQSPEQQLGLGGFYNDMNSQLGMMGYAAGGGVSHLGDYSDGGRLLKGPGDGVSDSIPASINGRQPARLADGEFVVPARIVSELGNGSTEAGAKRLYAMMDRVQKARRKTVGKNRVATNTKAEKYLPA
jgi:hypothetical protein